MTPKRDRVSRLPEAIMLAVSLLVAIGIAVLSYRSAEAARRVREQQSLTQQVIKLNADLLSDLTDAETGQRGFLLTGQERYLEPYNQAIASIPNVLERFKAVTVRRPDQRSLAEKLPPLVSQKLGELDSTIKLRRANEIVDALAIVNTDRGKGYMDQIRVVCSEIEQTATIDFVRFESDSERLARELRRISIAGTLLLAAFLAISTVTIFRGMERREQLLHESYASEKLLATTLTGIADAVIATDANANITFINPVAQKLCGWSESEAIGIPIERVLTIVNETTRLPTPNPVRTALEQGAPGQLTNHTTLISKSGEQVPIDDSAAPITNEEGNVVGAVMVFRDVTAKRNAETQLRNANAELQQFVDAAAHDLRSPVNSVSVMTELLASQFQQDLADDGKELIVEITRALKRLSRLIEDLVAFARASHFDTEAARPISLDVSLQSALKNLQADIQRTGANITSDPLPEAAIGEAHAIQLFQNLIGNALKYTGDGAPRIQVRGGRKHAEVLVSIEDHGIGIESRYLEEIFKPFKRLHGQEHPGSGIGLATCQKIVTAYGGRIWAQSIPRNGSTFFFTLPAEGRSGA